MFGQSEKFKGTVLMVTACMFFCVMSSLVKILGHVDGFMIGLWRFVIGMLLLGLMAVFGAIRLKFHNRRLLFIRGLLGGAGVVMFYFAVVNLGVSKGVVLGSTYPIFAYVLSVILLKERPSLVSAAMVVTAFFGIYLVVAGNNGGAGIFEEFGLWEILAVSVGLIGGIVIVTIRKLHETDNSYSIYFSQCAIGFCVAAAPAIGGTGGVDFTAALILVLIGVTAAVGQLMMTQSYKHLPVRTGAILAMLEPVFCYLAGVVIFGELFTAKSAVGTMLIIGSCVAVVLHEGIVRKVRI
jgi:drug/metabolite transporter (DMT)-like permease